MTFCILLCFIKCWLNQEALIYRGYLWDVGKYATWFDTADVAGSYWREWESYCFHSGSGLKNMSCFIYDIASFWMEIAHEFWHGFGWLSPYIENFMPGIQVLQCAYYLLLYSFPRLNPSVAGGRKPSWCFVLLCYFICT